MKELSIKEKAKAYDEAIDKIADVVEAGTIEQELAKWLFPELKESEDERIRKALINFFSTSAENGEQTNGVYDKDIVAWLEKQGEKPTDEEIKVLLQTEYEKGRADAIAEMQKPWSEENELYIRELESLVKQVWATAEHENDKDTIHKMSDLSFFLKTLKPQLKQEWSEEDENMLDGIIEASTHHCYLNVTDREWLKSLKDRVGCEANCTTTKEWSEEEEKEIAVLEAYIRSNDWSERHVDRALGIVDELVNKVKSLKSQNRWKPSEEQMNQLYWWVSISKRDGHSYKHLESLYNDLKKLK